MFAAVPVSIHSLPLFLAHLQACLQKAHIPTIVILMATHQVFISMLVHPTSITCHEQSLRSATANCGKASSACMHVVSQSCCALCVSLPEVYAWNAGDGSKTFEIASFQQVRTSAKLLHGRHCMSLGSIRRRRNYIALPRRASGGMTQ